MVTGSPVVEHPGTVPAGGGAGRGGEADEPGAPPATGGRPPGPRMGRAVRANARSSTSAHTAAWPHSPCRSQPIGHAGAAWRVTAGVSEEGNSTTSSPNNSQQHSRSGTDPVMTRPLLCRNPWLWRMASHLHLSPTVWGRGGAHRSTVELEDFDRATRPSLTNPDGN